VLKEDSCQSI